MSETKSVELEAKPVMSSAEQKKADLFEKCMVDLYQQARDFLGDGELSQGEIILILPKVMCVVERYKGLTGDDKKKLVLGAVEKLIDVKVSDKEVSDMLKLLVRTTLPSVIDAFVSIDKKQIRIKVQKGLRWLFCCK
jgi:hypothetical protein